MKYQIANAATRTSRITHQKSAIEPLGTAGVVGLVGVVVCARAGAIERNTRVTSEAM
jgi:hypothetical protein